MRRLLCCAALAAAAASGCSPPPPGGIVTAPVATVSGALVARGKPAAGALLTLHPANDPASQAIRPRATADANGLFQVSTYRAGDGAPPGEYVVTVYWPAPRKPAKGDPEEEDSLALPPDLLKNAYTNPATSTLRATVREGETNRLDLKLP